MNDDHETSQVELPGLELRSELPGELSALRKSVIVTLEALQKDNLLEARHTAMAQLCLELADAVVAGIRSRRASAAAMASAQLIAALKELPAPLAADLKERFDKFVEKLLEEEPAP